MRFKHKGRTLLLSLAAFVFVSGCSQQGEQQTTEEPAAASSDDAAAEYDLAVVNARLIDGTGAAPIDGATILVSGDRVVGITRDEVSAAKVIDAQGKAVIPGYIDAHVHSSLRFLIPDEVIASGMGGYPEPQYALTSHEHMQDFIDNTVGPRMMEFLESGLTTIVDPGAYFPYIVQIRDMERAGDLIAPRMFVSAKLFTAPTGHPAFTVCNSNDWCIEHLTINTDDPDVARAGVTELVEGGVDGLKLVYDDSRGWGEDFPSMTHEVLMAVVDEGHKQGVKVTAHTNGVDASIEAVLAGVDGFVHSVEPENGSYDHDGQNLTDLLVKHDVPVVTTVGYESLVPAPHELSAEEERMIVEEEGPGLRAQADAGVTFVFGTDFEGIGIDPDPRSEQLLPEVHVLRLSGFSEAEIFEMLTANAAKHPLTSEDIGTIEPGKYADFMIVNGDPLADVTVGFNPTLVIKAGQVVVDKRQQLALNR